MIADIAEKKILKQKRISPQLSVTVRPSDKKKLWEIQMHIIDKGRKSITTSGIVQKLIEFAHKHMADL